MADRPKAIIHPDTYKKYTVDVPLNKRVKRGIIGAGLPSAFISGILSAPGGFRNAAKVAVRMGLLGTTIGAVLAPKKQSIYVKK